MTFEDFHRATREMLGMPPDLSSVRVVFPEWIEIRPWSYLIELNQLIDPDMDLDLYAAHVKETWYIAKAKWEKMQEKSHE